MSGNPAPSRRRTARAALLVAIPVMLVALTACSEGPFGLPAASTEQAHHVGNLWLGAWIASLVIGGIVWALIGWAVIRYRRKDGDAPAPRQTTYHLPLELLYTLVPFLIVGVLFFYTVQSQDNVLAKSPGGPAHTVNVLGQKWSWTFNYMEDRNPAVGNVVHEAGTIEKIPDLYLPVNESVRFNLTSADVIHSFWVPEFYFKMDVIPGHPNSFDVTPNRTGTFLAKCAELCGTYHSAMLFNVHVVSVDEYNAYLKGLAAKGQTGELKAPVWVNTVPSAPAEEHDR